MRSPPARSGSRLVARMCVPLAPRNNSSAKEAAASITCSQLSSTMRICLSPRKATRLEIVFSERTAMPSADATALETSAGSDRGAQFDEADAVRECASQSIRDCQGDFCLSDPSGSHDRDEAILRQSRGEHRNGVGSAHHSKTRSREVVWLIYGRDRPRRMRRPRRGCNGSDEAV